MNHHAQAPDTRIPLAGAAVVVCLILGSAGGWKSTLPLPALPPAQVEPPPLARDLQPFPMFEDHSVLIARQKQFRASHGRAVMVVFPVRIGQTLDTTCAVHLARTLPRANVCEMSAVMRPLALARSRPELGPKDLWNLAHDFRAFVGRHPIDADYSLFVEYVLVGETREFAALHLVLCDARGDWVIVDRQDFRSEDFHGAAPTSTEEADLLVVRRLQFYLAGASPDATRDERDGRSHRPLAAVTPHRFKP